MDPRPAPLGGGGYAPGGGGCIYCCGATNGANQSPPNASHERKLLRGMFPIEGGGAYMASTQKRQRML
jgi:hypothetical protein